jgi:hypothetical protein
MNKQEFFKWLNDQNCEIRPKEGINNSAPAFEVFNKRYPDRYCYFFLYPHKDNVSSHTIEKCIKHLGIESPKLY